MELRLSSIVQNKKQEKMDRHVENFDQNNKSFFQIKSRNKRGRLQTHSTVLSLALFSRLPPPRGHRVEFAALRLQSAFVFVDEHWP